MIVRSVEIRIVIGGFTSLMLRSLYMVREMRC